MYNNKKVNGLGYDKERERGQNNSSPKRVVVAWALPGLDFALGSAIELDVIGTVFYIRVTWNSGTWF